jgi:hypothetical protein
LFFALNPARGVKCITGGEAKRNRRNRNSPVFQSPARDPCKGEIMIAVADNLAPCGALEKERRF